MYTDVAGYKQVGTLMQETAVAIEAAGLGPVMHLLLKNPKNLRPSVAFDAEAKARNLGLPDPLSLDRSF